MMKPTNTGLLSIIHEGKSKSDTMRENGKVISSGLKDLGRVELSGRVCA